MSAALRTSAPDNGALCFDTILVRKSGHGFNHLALPDFLALPVDERIEMILDRRIRFVNGEDEVSPYAALESLERHRKHAAGR